MGYTQWWISSSIVFPAGAFQSASDEMIRQYLDDLATRHQVAAATQRPALNALIFLVREVAGRDMDQFGRSDRVRMRVQGSDAVLLSLDAWRMKNIWEEE